MGTGACGQEHWDRNVGMGVWGWEHRDRTGWEPADGSVGMGAWYFIHRSMGMGE